MTDRTRIGGITTLDPIPTRRNAIVPANAVGKRGRPRGMTRPLVASTAA